MHFLNQMAVVFSAPKDPQELLAELLKFRLEFSAAERPAQAVPGFVTRHSHDHCSFDFVGAITSWGVLQSSNI
jgi:hypothetical protein